MKLRSLMTICALLALPTIPAMAEGTAEQRAACTGDAMKLCKEDIPDAGKVESCLRGKMADVSPACRTEFDKAAKK